MLKKEVKIETTVDKIRKGRLKSIESTVRGGTKDSRDASQVPSPSVGQSGRDEVNSRKGSLTGNYFVPVVDKNGIPLMPTTASRARRWVKSRKATYFWSRGIWSVRLNVDPSSRILQNVVVGIDPGSKREGYTTASNSHVYLNLNVEAVHWVKSALETRRNLRISRRGRTTPCRKNKHNRSKNHFPPSTKSRWQWKLRIVRWLDNLYPVTGYVVEDIKASKNGKSKSWNTTFSPLETGKKWFYSQLEKPLKIIQGYETAEMRKALGLEKTKHKLQPVFSAHCVDSYAMAHSVVGCPLDNKSIICIKPLQFKRRQLHVQNFKSGYRKPYGGTLSMGLVRGSLVVNSTYGLALVGGTAKGKISLHSLNGKRFCQNIDPLTNRFLTYSKWTAHFNP